MKILFWDIDGTLIRSGKAGLYAFQQATAELYGQQPDFSRITTAGMTDCHIASEIIRTTTGRQPSTDEAATLARRYEELLPAELVARQGLVIPPVREILEYLDSRPDFVSLLLTGNTAAGAKTKLTHYAIAHFFDFPASAFSDDCLKRSDIAARALASATRRYPSVPAADIFIIGDTPNDIDCGKSIGARTIAVATGGFSLPQLAAHSPWWVVERLPSPPEFAQKLAEPV